MAPSNPPLQAAAPASAGADAGSAAASHANGATAPPAAQQTETGRVIFIFNSTDSMEEVRSALPRYRFDDKSIKEDVSRLSQSISQRLKQLQAQQTRA